MISRGRFAAAAMAVLVLAGCAGGGAPVVPTTSQTDDAESGYVIGPGDGLSVFVWGHPDLSIGVEVRPDGAISTPLVEDLPAAGKTSTQLARDIEGALAEFVRSPTVTVIVQSFVGEFEQQIRVVGEATAPQALSYRRGMTLLDAMITVGGLSEFAAGNRAKVIRKVGNESVEIKVRIEDLLQDGDIEQNIPLLPGDLIVIPESFF